MSTLSFDVSEGIATLTFKRPRTLNAITSEDYDALAEALRLIDARKDVVATLLQATGDWFCAGTDVKAKGKSFKSDSVRENFTRGVARANTDCSRALYTHSKLLVAALNGPVMGKTKSSPTSYTKPFYTGIASAFLGHFDFIYCMPGAWLSVPFAFLGIISEAGSSVSFVNRMGLSKANEALLFGKKMEADELLACGFVNKIFPQQSCESFHMSVRVHVLAQIGGLDRDAVLAIKQLIQHGLDEKNPKDAVNLRESYTQAERFATGVPAVRFLQIANKEIKHKL
ncbi:ClpP/crotonase [Phellopilus nigrolimitatus]|nr:ClpP/crotonase [Phellopilus nigrolimitatus]